MLKIPVRQHFSHCAFQKLSFLSKNSILNFFCIGTHYFEQLARFKSQKPLQKIFKRYEDYCFQAFLEVSMLYNNATCKEEYYALCESIGKEHVHMYPAWKSFLKQIPDNVHPIIVSSSIREVWESMRLQNGMKNMSIIAGNHLSFHPYIIDCHAKALVANTLRLLHGGCRVISFGDSGER